MLSPDCRIQRSLTLALSVGVFAFAAPGVHSGDDAARVARLALEVQRAEDSAFFVQVDSFRIARNPGLGCPGLVAVR